MRTFLVSVFALMAVVLGGAWAVLKFGIATPETNNTQVEAVAAPPPPPAPVESMPVETVEDGRVFSPATAPRALASNTPTLRDQFEAREVTYNRPPSLLALGKHIDVSLVINATDEAGAGVDALDGFSGTIVEREVNLSDVVSAHLSGVGFDVISQSVERQKLSGSTLNRWQWRVTPTEVGTQTLILEIYGYADGGLAAEPLNAFRDQITVEVRELDRLITLAQKYEPVFAVGAGFAGGISALFAFLRFRGERKKRKAR